MAVLSILLSVVASCALGFWWYSHNGFGKPWVKMMGLDPKKMKEHNKDMNKTYSLMLLGTFAQAYVLHRFYQGAGDLTLGLMLVFWLWVGFTLPTQLNNHLFSGRKFQPKLLAIDSGYQLVSLTLMVLIFRVL